MDCIILRKEYFRLFCVTSCQSLARINNGSGYAVVRLSPDIRVCFLRIPCFFNITALCYICCEKGGIRVGVPLPFPVVPRRVPTAIPTTVFKPPTLSVKTVIA